MSDLRDTILPVTRVFAMEEGIISAIPFVDTSGGAAAASYVTLTNLSGVASTGYMKLAVSADASDLYYVEKWVTGGTQLTPTMIGAPSSIAGVVGPAGTTLSLSLQASWADKCTGAIVENQLGGKTIFALTYGNIKRANSVRDQALSDIK